MSLLHALCYWDVKQVRFCHNQKFNFHWRNEHSFFSQHDWFRECKIKGEKSSWQFLLYAADLVWSRAKTRTQSSAHGRALHSHKREMQCTWLLHKNRNNVWWHVTQLDRIEGFPRGKGWHGALIECCWAEHKQRICLRHFTKRRCCQNCIFMWRLVVFEIEKWVWCERLPIPCEHSADWLRQS